MKIAVYGTLKRDYGNHNRIFTKGAYKSVTYGANFEGMMFHVGNGAFPGIVLRQDIPKELPYYPFVAQHSVCAEVYEIDEKIRQEMDELESHPDFYKRTPYKHHHLGEVHIYALRHTRYLRGIVKVIPGGYWWGPNTTAMIVDFGDGTQKPKPKGWEGSKHYNPIKHPNAHFWDDEDDNVHVIKELHPEILIDVDLLNEVKEA